MESRNVRWTATALGALGVFLVGILHWQVFFWVPTETTMGIVQRIFYIHVPAAWVGVYIAMGIVTLASVFYLWLGDERLDMAALSAAEGGMVFLTVALVTGPLWARIAWGTWWTWEPRLTLTLLLWFIYLAYFMVRSSTESPERGKKFAAVVAIVAAVDLPLIHLSVTWFRSLHPEPVVMDPDGPSLHPDMLITLFTGLGAFLVLFLGLFLFRYGLEAARRESALAQAGRSG